MSVLDGPGEGTWSVFAQKVVAERDQLREELAAAREVIRAATALLAAADACDREAERHPSSRSSAPVVRYINAMARLRIVIHGSAASP